VSESDNCRCLGSTQVAVKVVGMNWTPEEESLEATSENRQTWHVAADCF